MNGDLGKVYGVVNEINTKLEVGLERQDLQHKQNRKDIEEIKKHVNGCSAIKNQLKIQWVLIFLILTGLVGLAFK